MLDVFLMLVAMAAQGGGQGGDKSMATAEPAPMEQAAEPAPQPTPQASAEVPMGKFTTAQEVKPILSMTKPNWIAVREFNGQDIVYFTQLMSWRCGLNAIRYSINDGPIEVLPLPPCYIDTASPNAIKENDNIMIMGLELGSVQKVHVEIFYDDMSTDSATYDRQSVLMP